MTTAIKRALTRRYSDTGHIAAIVEWDNGSATFGVATGVRQPSGTHMTALFERSEREGLNIEHEEW